MVQVWDCCTNRWHLICDAVRRRWKDVHRAQALSKGVPRGLRRRGARKREANRSRKQIASDFGIAESCLRNWMRQADVEGGLKPGSTAAEKAELREAKKRIRLLEQESEVLRRAAAYLSEANLPGK